MKLLHCSWKGASLPLLLMLAALCSADGTVQQRMGEDDDGAEEEVLVQQVIRDMPSHSDEPIRTTNEAATGTDYDPSMGRSIPFRRSSPLNKNFIRFGRSGDISKRFTEIEDENEPTDGYKSYYWHGSKGDKRAPSNHQLHSNFIRFGRSSGVTATRRSFFPDTHHRRFGRRDLKSNFIRFGRSVNGNTNTQ